MHTQVGGQSIHFLSLLLTVYSARPGIPVLQQNPCISDVVCSNTFSMIGIGTIAMEDIFELWSDCHPVV